MPIILWSVRKRIIFFRKNHGRYFDQLKFHNNLNISEKKIAFDLLAHKKIKLHKDEDAKALKAHACYISR